MSDKKIALAFTADQLHIAYQMGIHFRTREDDTRYAEWASIVEGILVQEAERLKVEPHAALAMTLTILETLLAMMNMSLFQEEEMGRIFVPGGRV